MATLYDEGKGVLWIPTYGAELDILDKKSGIFTNYRHDKNNPNSIGSNTICGDGKYETSKSYDL